MDWNSFLHNSKIKNLSSLLTSTILGNGVSAIFWLYLADLLGQESYGELGYLISIAGITSNVVLVGGEYVMTVYTARNMNIQSVLYLISLVTSGISAIILYIIFQNIGLSAYVIGFVIFMLVISEIQGRKLYQNYAKNFLLQKFFFVFFAFVLFHIIGEEGILLGYAFSFLLFSKRMIISLKTKKFDFKFLREKSGFIANNYSLDLAGVLRGEIDKLMIAPLFGFGLLGNYYLGLQIVSILSIIPGVVFTYLLPRDASGESTKKLRMVTIFSSFVFALIGIFVAPNVLTILFPQYQESVALIPVLSLSVIPITISSMYTSKFLGEEKSSFVLIAYLLSFITLVLTILLLSEKLGVNGLAYAYLLSSTVQAIFLFSMNFFNISIFRRKNE